MVGKKEMTDIFQAVGVPSMKRLPLEHNLKSWEALLKPKVPEETELFLKSQGEEVYLFSNNILMVVEQTDKAFRNLITFYPLNRTEFCELKILHIQLLLWDIMPI